MDLEKFLQKQPLYEPERRIVCLADALATEIGGDSPDVIRNGKRNLPNGKKLIAEILDDTAVDDHTPAETPMLFSLKVVDPTDAELEVAWVAPLRGYSFYNKPEADDPDYDLGGNRHKIAEKLGGFLKRINSIGELDELN